MFKTITTSAKVGLSIFFVGIMLVILTLKLLTPPTALPASADTTLFSAERAMEHLNIIAKTPHSLGTLENEAVIEYLVKELEDLGLEVSIQDTLISRTSKRSGATRIARVKNIIGKLNGRSNSKAVMLMAHHDSQPNTPGAADDGSGVVSILETVRAIKSQGPLKNDLVVLFTDAEEIGLMGAKAFVAYHPWLKDIGILINLEARGNQGLSLSFEMNPNNGWIIQEFAKSAPYPFTNSMAYEVYKVMPNDTDFSEFRETEVAGINSACVEGFVNYHSMTDTPENISKGLLQHHGSNMLGMLQHFGNLEIKNTKGPDAIFFNPIGSSIIIYPASYDFYFIILTVLLFLLVGFIGVKKEQVNLSHLFIGTGYFLVLLVIAGLGGYLWQQGIIKMNPHFTLFYANNFYNVAYYFFIFIGWTALLYSFIFGWQTKLNSLSLSLGGCLMLVMSIFGMRFSLPTSIYLLYIPLIIFLAVQLALLLLNITPEDHPKQFALGQIISLLPAITLWSQTIYFLFFTFGLSEAIIAPCIILCFLGVLLIPTIHLISKWQKMLLPILSSGLILFGLIAGALTSNYSKEKPLQTHLIYGLDADANEAQWVTNKKYKNEWVQQLISSKETKSFTSIYPNWEWKVWSNPAKAVSIETSNLQVKQDSLNQENEKILEIDVQFSSFVNSIEFFLEASEQISKVSINDYPIESKVNKENGTLYFNFFAPSMEGFQLKIITKNEKQKINMIERIIGLPTQLFPSPMPENMIHGPGYRSNVTLVKRTFEF